MSAPSNKTVLLVLMVVLIIFVVLLVALAIVFIIALRKRAPVVKVVMAPIGKQDEPEEEEEEEDPEIAKETTESTESTEEEGETESKPQSKPTPAPEPEEEEDDDDEAPTFVTEGQERVRYNRSLTAKLCQLGKEAKEWYSAIKNELLSYEKIKDRMSWKRETFRAGRMTLARLTVRGKTLCLLLAVEPVGYNGTKYTVEDVSNVANTADTPTMYRIKSARRLKYAIEMIAGIMKELKIYKNSHYEAQDFYMAYEGDMGLMQRGLVKRVVTGSNRTFKIEEVDKAEAAATTEEQRNTDTTDNN